MPSFCWRRPPSRASWEPIRDYNDPRPLAPAALQHPELSAVPEVVRPARSNLTTVERSARIWFGLTALCVVVGVGMQVVINARTPEYFGGSSLGRAANVFAFFTIQSNVIVGVTSALLAVRVARASTVFAVLRLVGVVAITVTMVIYHLTLAGLVQLDTTGQVANQLQHTVVPLLCLAGWLVLGPHCSIAVYSG